MKRISTMVDGNANNDLKRQYSLTSRVNRRQFMFATCSVYIQYHSKWNKFDLFLALGPFRKIMKIFQNMKKVNFSISNTSKIMFSKAKGPNIHHEINFTLQNIAFFSLFSRHRLHKTYQLIYVDKHA